MKVALIFYSSFNIHALMQDPIDPYFFILYLVYN